MFKELLKLLLVFSCIYLNAQNADIDISKPKEGKSTILSDYINSQLKQTKLRSREINIFQVCIPDISFKDEKLFNEFSSKNPSKILTWRNKTDESNLRLLLSAAITQFLENAKDFINYLDSNADKFTSEKVPNDKEIEKLIKLLDLHIYRYRVEQSNLKDQIKDTKVKEQMLGSLNYFLHDYCKKFNEEAENYGKLSSAILKRPKEVKPESINWITLKNQYKSPDFIYPFLQKQLDAFNKKYKLIHNALSKYTKDLSLFPPELTLKYIFSVI